MKKAAPKMPAWNRWKWQLRKCLATDEKWGRGCRSVHFLVWFNSFSRAVHLFHTSLRAPVQIQIISIHHLGRLYYVSLCTACCSWTLGIYMFRIIARVMWQIGSSLLYLCWLYCLSGFHVGPSIVSAQAITMILHVGVIPLMPLVMFMCKLQIRDV